MPNKLKGEETIKHRRALLKITISLAALVFGGSNAFADSNAVDEVTVTVPVSCSITGTVGSIHTTTMDIGTYEDEIGETSFNVLCNDANGFAVYAVGYSNNLYGNTNMVPSTLAASNGIATGIATSGGISNWAMKLTAVSGDYTPSLETGFNTYHVVPDEYTKVASINSNTDAVSGSSFKSTYAVYVSGSQPADTYIGKVKYTVVHPAGANAPVPEMQNLPSASCTSTPMQVVDKRDNHIYTIQRLLDDNCWMIDNLDLGRTELTVDLTSSNTNLSTTVTATTFNSWKENNSYNPGSGAKAPDPDYNIGTRTNGEFYSIDGIAPNSETAYGTLYNYYSATAGTISGDSNAANAEYDICPAGWRLPTSSYYGEFHALFISYGSSVYSFLRPIANNGAAFALAGYFYGNTPDYQDAYGRYWSSTGTGGIYSNILAFSNSGVEPYYNQTRGAGASIRCILKESD